MVTRNNDRDRYEFSPDQAVHRVVLTGCWATCTRCGGLAPMSEQGLRTMPDGTLRNQPQCVSCRGLPPEGR